MESDNVAHETRLGLPLLHSVVGFDTQGDRVGVEGEQLEVPNRRVAVEEEVWGLRRDVPSEEEEIEDVSVVDP